ncbi:MAG TPA: S49 family peptidase, partial [Vulgatibacter sp.]
MAWLVPFLAIAALAPYPALAESTSVLSRFPSSGLDQPAGSASLTDGPNALSVNPAGLGFQRGFSLFYLHETGPEPGRELASSSGDGIYLGDRFFGFLGLGFGVEWMRPKVGESRPDLHYRRTNWAFSLGGDALALGAVAHVFTHGVMDNHTSWDVGAMARPDRHVSLGFTIRDVGAPSAAGAPLPRHYVASIGARPFGDWLTLAVDGEVLGGENDRIENGFGALRLGYTALARVIPGVTVFSSLAHRIDGDAPLLIQAGLEVDVDGLGVVGTPLIRTRDGDAGFLLGATLRAFDVPSLDLAPRRTVARVDLDKALSREGELRLFGGASRDPLVDFVAGLEDLGRDDRVGGVILEVRSPDLGMGRAYEVRRAIELFREASGKKVGVLLYGADDATSFLATGADRVWVTPDAALFVNGFSSDAEFFAGTLEMIGVSVDVAKVGAYKNAPDAFTRRDASPAQKEVARSLLDDIYPRYVAAVSDARGLEPEAFRAAVDRGVLTPKEAQELGLIDAVIYPDQLEEKASELVGRPVHLSKETLEPASWKSWGPAHEIAVIPIEGTISGGYNEGGFGFVRTTGARSVVASLQEAAADPQVRAILL